MSVSEEPAAVRQSVKNFLTTWLVEKNTRGALRSFSASAFTNQAMFHESCSGYISDKDRRSREGIEKGVQKFLADVTNLLTAKNLNESLDPKPVMAMAERLRGKATNDASEDRFLVLPSRHIELESLATTPEAVKLLKERLASTPFYVSFVPIGQGLAYLIWIKEETAWKIYHASLVCM